MAAAAWRGQGSKFWILAAVLAGCGSSKHPGPPRPLDTGAIDVQAADAAASPDAAEPEPGSGDAAAAPEPDGASAAPDLGSSQDSSPVSGQVICGSGTVPLPTGSLDSLVVAPDGTIFYTEAGDWVSRIRPGMPEERQWAHLGGGGRNIGVTYDPKRKIVYAALRNRIRIAVIEVTTGAPNVTELPPAPGSGGVYGMTLGEDGALYYLDESGGTISRTAPEDWTHSEVATGIPGRPHALAFGPDGWLYVTQLAGTDVWRLQLAAGKEVKRERFASVPLTHGNGITFDDAGRLYVTAGGTLFQLATDGQMLLSIPDAGEGGLDFGAGALSCGDLYVGSSTGLRVHTLEVHGLNVPWHRVP